MRARACVCLFKRVARDSVLTNACLCTCHLTCVEAECFPAPAALKNTCLLYPQQGHPVCRNCKVKIILTRVHAHDYSISRSKLFLQTSTPYVVTPQVKANKSCVDPSE